jgi:hypothetical protein
MSEILELEDNIANAEELVARRQMALKLSQIPEFKKLFMEEYFVNEAARLVQLSADPALTTDQQKTALDMAVATGHTKRYLSMAIQMGAHAERELPDMRSTLNELRSLGAND